MITDNNYLDNNSLSQSRLKRILKHPQEFLNFETSEYDEPKDSIIIGDGVDILLTQEEGTFENNFYTLTEEKPSGQMGDFVWNLFAYRNESNAEQIAYDIAGFKRDTIEKVRERFKKEGSSYYQALLDAEGKTVITPEQYNTIQSIKNSFLTHEFTKPFFNKEKYDVYFQIPLTFVYKDVPCKALLDMIAVDKETRVLYPIDIKTSYVKTTYWASNIWKFRYDIQAAFYTEGLIQNNYQEKYNAKSMNNFRFMVESQAFPGSPLIYEVNDKILEVGKSGGKVFNRDYEGFDQAIDRYLWHSTNDLWKYPKEDYENKGIRILNLLGNED